MESRTGRRQKRRPAELRGAAFWIPSGPSETHDAKIDTTTEPEPELERETELVLSDDQIASLVTQNLLRMFTEAEFKRKLIPRQDNIHLTLIHRDFYKTLRLAAEIVAKEERARLCQEQQRFSRPSRQSLFIGDSDSDSDSEINPLDTSSYSDNYSQEDEEEDNDSEINPLVMASYSSNYSQEDEEDEEEEEEEEEDVESAAFPTHSLTPIASAGTLVLSNPSSRKNDFSVTIEIIPLPDQSARSKKPRHCDDN